MPNNQAKGRPPLPEHMRKDRFAKFRLRNGLRSRLDEAALEAGRSVSEEIEFRLERTFIEDRERQKFATWPPKYGPAISVDSLANEYRLVADGLKAAVDRDRIHPDGF